MLFVHLHHDEVCCMLKLSASRSQVLPHHAPIVREMSDVAIISIAVTSHVGPRCDIIGACASTDDRSEPASSSSSSVCGTRSN